MVGQGIEWRTRHNEEIDNILREEDTVRFVKGRRITWIGHVERMKDSRMSKTVMREKIYIPREEEVDPRLDGWTMFKTTYGRWGLKDGKGEPKIETCGGE
jgi:Holliday junction resolvase-like predicted endonuclease